MMKIKVIYHLIQLKKEVVEYKKYVMKINLEN